MSLGVRWCTNFMGGDWCAKRQAANTCSRKDRSAIAGREGMRVERGGSVVGPGCRMREGVVREEVWGRMLSRLSRSCRM